MKKYLRIISLALSVVILSLNVCSCALFKNGPLVVKAGDIVKPVGKKADTVFKKSLYDFSIELLKKSVENDKNIFISSYSLISALALLYNASENETKAQFEKLLGMDIDTLNSYLYQFNSSLIERNSNDVSLSIANSIWVNKNRINVNEVYLQKTMGYYKADIYREDFTDPSLVNKVNNWCYENTGHMIKKILDSVDANAIMYLMNAIFFDAKWEDQYESNQVSSRDFYNYDGTISNIKFMNSKESEGFVSDDKSYVGVKKDYKNGEYSFVAILPSEGTDIYDFVNTLDGKKYEEIFENRFYGDVYAKIPKMKIEYEYNLEDILSNMGLDLAFNQEKADFSSLGKSNGNIFVSEVKQKTALEVDEKGTKAAAITIIGMKATAVAPSEDYLEVILDRPFVLLIVDNNTNIPLFTGVINNMK